MLQNADHDSCANRRPTPVLKNDRGEGQTVGVKTSMPFSNRSNTMAIDKRTWTPISSVADGHTNQRTRTLSYTHVKGQWAESP